MAYASNREVSDATPGATMLTALESLLTAHDSWTFIETEPTYSRKIWKNDSNQSGRTFHVALGTTTTALGIYIFEQWNTDTHLPLYITPQGTINYTPTANAAFSETESWSSAFPQSITGNTSDYSYYFMVTQNCIVAQCGASYADNYPVFAGVWDHYWSGIANDNYCGLVQLGYNNANAGAVTRAPGWESTAVSDTFGVTMQIYSDYNAPALGETSVTYGSTVLASPVLVAAQTTGNRGVTYPEVMTLRADTAKIGIGSQVVINGSAYVIVGSYAKSTTGTNRVYAVSKVIY